MKKTVSRHQPVARNVTHRVKKYRELAKESLIIAQLATNHVTDNARPFLDREILLIQNELFPPRGALHGLRKTVGAPKKFNRECYEFILEVLRIGEASLRSNGQHRLTNVDAMLEGLRSIPNYMDNWNKRHLEELARKLAKRVSDARNVLQIPQRRTVLRKSQKK